MESRRIGALAAVVGTVSLLTKFGPTYLLNSWVAHDRMFPSWLPTLGTYGETTIGYRLLLRIGPPAVTLALALALGYYVGKRLDLDRDYRRFITSVSVGSTIGVVVTWGMITLWLGLYGFGDATDAAFSLATFVSQLLDVALVVVLGAVAGATFTHFRTGGGSQMAGDTGSSAVSGPRETPPESEDSRTQSVGDG